MAGHEPGHRGVIGMQVARQHPGAVTVELKDDDPAVNIYVGGNAQVTIDSDGAVTIASAQSLAMKAGSNLTIEAQGNFDLKASGTMNINAASSQSVTDPGPACAAARIQRVPTMHAIANSVRVGRLPQRSASQPAGICRIA